MSAADILTEEHRARSESVRRLVQDTRGLDRDRVHLGSPPPRRIIQFWDDAERMPADVQTCIDSWREVERQNIERILFHAGEAREFIIQNLGLRHAQAYDRCYHPAMQSDYFRLSYILVEGGCYIDADDVYNGPHIEYLFNDDRLKVQPLCYDISTDRMITPSAFVRPGATSASWIFYFNNNPLIAGRQHPIVKHALEAATQALEQVSPNEPPEIQATTGPGILTKSIVQFAAEVDEVVNELIILKHWEKVAVSKWPLSYRSDYRNWRISNQRVPDSWRDSSKGFRK